MTYYLRRILRKGSVRGAGRGGFSAVEIANRKARMALNIPTSFLIIPDIGRTGRRNPGTDRCSPNIWKANFECLPCITREKYGHYVIR